ncbi:MAG: hypothetical protein R3A13_04000 [Bdellovibrionota bacterium]
MSSRRHNNERCRVCGSKEVNTVSPKKDISLFKRVRNTYKSCNRCGVSYSVPLIDLGTIREKQGIYLYSGCQPTTPEYTEISLFKPKNEIAAEDQQALESSKSNNINSDKDPDSYHLSVTLAGLKLSIEINKELAQALGKSSGGFNKFLSGMKFEFKKKYLQATQKKKKKAASNTPKGF